MAPAPSGTLHVGSLRTALYNFLHARHHGGTFVLRVEDTDVERATDESMHSMIEALRWVGIDWDEGPEVGGDHGPYRQSERSALYRAVARRLEEAGHTYRDHRTREEHDALRERRRDRKLAPVLKAAELEHTGDQLARYEREGQPYTVRLRLPDTGEIVVDDLVRGEVQWEWANLSDPVLVRSDGSATYPLANTTDDVAQGVTLVCRGEDLLSATPLQAWMYRLLTEPANDGTSIVDAALDEAGLPVRGEGWGPPSAFAHLSMIVGEDRRKLSKRHGSASIQELAASGYLPETIVNYVALLGWSPGDGRERMDLDEMIAAFDLRQVSKPAAMFDIDKLAAFNGERIRGLSLDELVDRLVPYLDGTYGDALVASPPTEAERATLRGLAPLVQERMQRLDEVQGYAPAFFREQVELDPDSVERVLHKPDAGRVLEQAAGVLGELETWTDEAIEDALRGLKERLDLGAKKVFQPVRVAVTGSAVSPPLFESLALLDRQRVLDRIRAAIPMAADDHHP